MEEKINIEMATNAELEAIIEAAQDRFKMAQDNMKMHYEVMCEASRIYMDASKILRERKGLG